MLREQSPHPPDQAGVISWVHFGDLHMADADGQNYKDLLALVSKVNGTFAQAASFVFLPGDNADNGAAAQYRLVRSALDKLAVPWRAIVGDHDVQEGSFENFKHFMEPATHYSFQVGDVRFLALNAFSTPDPKSFDLSEEQLDWLEEQLQSIPATAKAVLLLHCYPTDLKQGSERLRELAKGPRILLIDMGHTHYNEVANDGATLYTATRSTGQIEEGPVGFSVTNIDGGVVSWSFLPLTTASLVMITSPADERFQTSSAPEPAQGRLQVRAKFWGDVAGATLQATLGGQHVTMQRIGDSQVWQAEMAMPEGDDAKELSVTASTATGGVASDRIRLSAGNAASNDRNERDQDNALEAWPERGLLGTQLGPNKNGKKW